VSRLPPQEALLQAQAMPPEAHLPRVLANQKMRKICRIVIGLI
jgi:hypothetical protein